jgi:hypothetical protein
MIARLKTLRLKVSRVDGDKDGDGDWGNLYAFGGRSFAVRDLQNRILFDSGNLSTAIAVAVIAGSWPALAQDAVAQFYRGKQINLFVGSTPGGGYDTYARLLARHLARHLPGQPAIVVQNMPGAGGLRSANHLYSVAAKDGTTTVRINMLTQANDAAEYQQEFDRQQHCGERSHAAIVDLAVSGVAELSVISIQ